jgi:hypothetical protein
MAIKHVSQTHPDDSVEVNQSLSSVVISMTESDMLACVWLSAEDALVFGMAIVAAAEKAAEELSKVHGRMAEQVRKDPT